MEKIKTSFDDLLGRKITAVFRDAEKYQLLFKTDAGDIGYYADGDCCSRSWFEHFAGIEALIGHTVNEVIEHETQDLEEGNPLKGKDTDCEQKYGWTFVTEYGRADLDMRNSSNGYYGGSACRTETDWNKTKTDAPIVMSEDF